MINKLQSPTNASKQTQFLPELITTLVDNIFTVTLDQVSSMYLTTFDCKLSQKEVNSEIAKIVNFNSNALQFVVLYDENKPLLGIMEKHRELKQIEQVK